MGAPRRKLRGAFVLLAGLLAIPAWAGPALRVGDCGLLPEASTLTPEPRPSEAPDVNLVAGSAVLILKVADDRVLVSPLPPGSVPCKSRTKLEAGSQGWIPLSAIRYVKLGTVRGSQLVVMPNLLKALGRSYSAGKICGGHLFTESASFYWTGDKDYPVGVLCTGELDGEPSTLSLLSAKAAPRSKSLEPHEGSSQIDTPTLIRALDALVGSQGK